MSRRVLIVDDDPFTRRLLEGLLAAKGFELTLAADAGEARRAFAGTDYNLVIMDQRLPGNECGLDLVREMRRARPQQLALLVTGFANVREAVRAVREGLFDYLTKPFEDLDELEAVIDKALELDRAYREIEALRDTLTSGERTPIVGRSHEFTAVLQQAHQVAPLDTTVLIEGESGTGKELIARTLHDASPRKSRRFIEINCGAITETLLESTLFGYERGAFTGAARSRPGCFEEADGGTLFLDEIADMSAHLQSALLRVLQQRSFARLGGTAQLQSDFRLICATNKPLAEEVRAGRFREDLFYRINVVALRVPSLRVRHGDVLLLAMHFLERYNRRFSKAVGPLAPDAIKHLESMAWPGNVRELQNVIERLVALKPDGIVSAADIDALEPAGAGAQPPVLTLSYEEARGGFERVYLAGLLEAAGGSMTEASRLSGLSRQNLYVRMKRWGLVTEQ